MQGERGERGLLGPKGDRGDKVGAAVTQVTGAGLQASLWASARGPQSVGGGTALGVAVAAPGRLPARPVPAPMPSWLPWPPSARASHLNRALLTLPRGLSVRGDWRSSGQPQGAHVIGSTPSQMRKRRRGKAARLPRAAGNERGTPQRARGPGFQQCSPSGA